MNQQLLTRLFRSIEGSKDSPLVKVAMNIIKSEVNKGHSKLAAKLRIILRDQLSKSDNYSSDLKITRTKEFKMPLDRRYRLPLATHIEHDFLRRHMILADSVETKINRIEKEYLSRERLAHHGLKPRTKILFHGPSGCGKSMTAERLAWDLGLPFYKVRFDTIISSYLGESATNLQQLFDSIKDFPCVLLLDEFDIIAQKRESKKSDVGEIHRIVNVLLGLLEEYSGEGILVATTNLEDSLDEALFRRFDDVIEMAKPDHSAINKLLIMSFSALSLDKDVKLVNIAKKMKGLSYAIIVKIANDAAKSAIISTRSKISKKDIEQAIEENIALNK